MWPKYELELKDGPPPYYCFVKHSFPPLKYFPTWNEGFIWRRQDGERRTSAGYILHLHPWRSLSGRPTLYKVKLQLSNVFKKTFCTCFFFCFKQLKSVRRCLRNMSHAFVKIYSSTLQTLISCLYKSAFLGESYTYSALRRTMLSFHGNILWLHHQTRCHTSNLSALKRHNQLYSSH